MEKVIKAGITFLLFALSFILQLFVLDNFSILGVKPNLFLVTIIVVGLNTNIYVSTINAFLIGVTVDILFGSHGLFTISYTVIGMLLGLVNDDYMKENLLSVAILTVFSTAIFELIQYIKTMITISKYVNIVFFLKDLALSIVLNVVIVVLICFVFKVIREKINKKQDKIYW